MKSEAYKRKVDTRDEFFVDAVDAALRIKKSDDNLRPKTPELCRRDANCAEADGGIFENLL